MNIVEVHEVTKRYAADAPNALDRVSFAIRQGEIFSLLGPNGAGKTTMIAILSTLLRPTAGTATVNGFAIEAQPMAVRRSIGVVPQELALYGSLSGRENLRFWGEMRGLSGAALREEIDEKLSLMDLTERAGDRVEKYSGGMKRRLNLAIGMLGNPPLLMLDEPTVGIDPQSRRHILDYVKELNRSGASILYTTHYMEEAQELSHRVGIIDHGKLIALGTLDELKDLVGEKEMLRLQFYQSEGGAALTNEVRGLEGIHEASTADGEVILNVDAAERVLPRVLTKTADLGLSVRNIEIWEPNLETVFLHLTGRALRD